MHCSLLGLKSALRTLAGMGFINEGRADDLKFTNHQISTGTEWLGMLCRQDALRVVRSAHHPFADLHYDGQMVRRNRVMATVLMCALSAVRIKPQRCC